MKEPCKHCNVDGSFFEKQVRMLRERLEHLQMENNILRSRCAEQARLLYKQGLQISSYEVSGSNLARIVNYLCFRIVLKSHHHSLLKCGNIYSDLQLISMGLSSAISTTRRRIRNGYNPLPHAIQSHWSAANGLTSAPNIFMNIFYLPNLTKSTNYATFSRLTVVFIITGFGV